MLLCMIHFTAANAREKKTYTTSIENNSLLLGLCTYISFVWLFFCLSRYPGGIIRSLQAESYQLWHYILRFLSISHTCQGMGFVSLLIFRLLKLLPSASPGARRSLCGGRGGEWGAPAWRQSVAPSIQPPSVTTRRWHDQHVLTHRSNCKNRRWNLGSTCIRHKTLIDSVGARILFLIWIFSVRQFKDAFMREGISPSKIPCLQFWKSLTYVLRVCHISYWETLWCP